ncbi:aldehyde dehydrogenase family protein [Mycolicibacterium hassiacum DSM 44199]|uniref:Aldehyde dehydrogenase family protein n=1 Tax=Mycolicibacterium hassiacum (strain DSM 44199 / CIP 105218 / JCM 12690 / 3849) TaxID=1122247 RepID=K5B7A8_MYCHD|nr:aldehyde dehydrogenase [Mycolicibacterium hassiacum]EKF21623.1 aldehyde dehydrogenase family protein [Mycolicibacterium hassiacum DSM 44199]MDA4084286.1 aldehyde dehydrogenase [Mycolicibacterium hassiacum DSM 44199]VCT91295.1 Geranial dehydrogenase [Mycolicibacterium hassiacum DSM 44199]
MTFDRRDRHGFFIDGALREPTGSERVEVIHPGNEEAVGSIPKATPDDMAAAVAAARRAFDEGPWPHTAPAERAEMLSAIADGLEKRLEELAWLSTAQNGMPITLARQSQGIEILRYYADIARDVVWEERRQGLAGTGLVRRTPVGVAGLIIPWNAPSLLMNKLPSALLAGCTVVVKPSPETPLDTYVLAEVLDDVGMPPGVVNIVAADAEVGQCLVDDPRVDKISFTGSTVAGRKIMAGLAERIGRVSLELGGKSASVLLDDAPLEAALPATMAGACLNNGQACIALSRVLAPRSRYDEVVETLGAMVGSLPVGDPFDESTFVGPLLNARQRDRALGYIELGKAEGARVVTGGGPVPGRDRGFWVQPTVLADVSNDMRVAQEEIFAAVISVIPYDGGDDAAVAMANDSQYGLSGAVWSADPERALDVARRIRTGTVTVNGFTYDVGLPFGGFKQSGIGREWGLEGLEAYIEYQTINLPDGL